MRNSSFSGGPTNPHPPRRIRSRCFFKPATKSAPAQTHCFPIVESKKAAAVSPPSIPGVLGGPGDSTFSFGNSASRRPAPTPTPTCTKATIFSDCLAACSGTVNDVSPGPVCGWTFVQGATGNSVSFTPGFMTFNIPNFFNARVEKAAPAPFSMQPLTIQFTFNEYIGNTQEVFYDLSIQDSAGLNSLDFFFDSTGFIYLQYGPNANAPFYNGVWVPTGGRHVVQIDLDIAGVPTLYIDGVAIPLVLMGSQVTFSQAQPGNVSQDSGWNSVVGTYTTPARFEKFFLTAVALPPTTEFCCP